MFEFQERLIYTGKAEKISEKGNNYTIVNFLDSEGKTFGVIANCQVPENLSQLQEVLAKFKLTPGRYNKLEIISIEI